MRATISAAMSLALLVSCQARADGPPAKPADPNAIAVVLERSIMPGEKDKLNQLIFGGLLEKFAQDNKIEATNEELDAFVLKLEEKEKESEAEWERDRAKLQEELKSPSLSERARNEKESRLKTLESLLKSNREMKERTQGMEEQMRPVKRQMAGRFVKNWKVNKALFAKYGGRVIFQQAGPEPLDAYRDFLKEQEKNGAFRIIDKQYEAPFWRYFTDDSMHTFCSKEDGAKFLDTPWWLMK